ncbi:phage tail spike protein [Staphylococcus delphini]|uniref:phage tail spike protein n=1 Tax=Staphylococcus delphini TaxID=53344 RepID=UPI003364C15A
MIHVMNFKGEIVDFISHSDNAVIQAVHNRNINERMETFDFTILSERTTHLQERNRIIIQDKNGQYREFIIDRISADIDGYTEVETVASYLEDITKARPYAPGKLEKMTTKQALSDVLKDAGWEVSDATEYGGIRTTSWTSYQTRYDVLLQLCTTYDMMADFYIEVGSNRVDKRLVVLRKRNPLFKGKEIEYGKDLIGLKRTVDFSEIKTALLCVGPEPEEGKKRLELVVKDDEAQAKYGLPGRYNWGVYEPESSEQNMSESRLRTLGTTELNKRKSEVITYEVTAVDIEKEFKHEIVNLGDKVRIKDREFTPPLYVEAEVISEEYDLIGEDATYTFGEYKEFKESDLRSPFDKKLDAIRQKLSDSLSNVNTIVKESLEGELQYFERKILKGDTPPDNPVNDLLWLDTSNPKVAVLRRYWNGEWIKSSAENAEDVGAVTREQALYSELSNTFVNLTIQHSRLMHDASEALESEYLVDTDIKANVSSKLNDTIGVFNQIKQNLDSMTSETATIGKLVDTQALFLEYREIMQALYNTIENAKIAINERFKLLQSQYTDEKYNEAMSKVAEGIGGTWNAETGQLLADIPSQKELEDALKTYINGQDEALKQLIDGEVNSKIKTAKDELSSNINEVSARVDNLEVGGRNLLRYTTQKYLLNRPLLAYSSGVENVDGKRAVIFNKSNDIIYLKGNEYSLEDGQIYTFSFYAKASEPLGLIRGVYISVQNAGFIPDTTFETTWKRYSFTFVAKGNHPVRIHMYPKISNGDGTYKSFYVTDWQLEKGNVVTDVTPAPEDVEEHINNAQNEATSAAKAYADSQDELQQVEAKAYADNVVTKEEQRAIDDAKARLETAKAYAEQKQQEALDLANAYTDKQLKPITATQTKQSTDIQQLKDSITFKADKTEVTTLYDKNIKPLERQVNDNSAELKIQSDKINSKISNEQYNADVNDIVSKLNSAETQREQLSNAINDRVTIKEYTDNKTATTNQINAAVNNLQSDIDKAKAETDKTLSVMRTQINQNGTNINARATKEEFNASKKTLSNVISDLSIDTTTGLTLSYDENGNIQSHTVGPDGIMLKGDRVNINVNKDFQVLAGNVNNKVGKDEIINRLNLSPEGLDINVNNVGIRGGDSSEYVHIKNDEITLYGTYTRNWVGATETNNVFTRLKDGHIRFRNNDKNRSIYISDLGISTFLDGTPTEASGTIQFFDYLYDSNARGLTIRSGLGVLGLRSEGNKIVMEADDTVNIGSNKYSIYLRPFANTRSGINEFQFYVKDNTDPKDTDGVLLFGELSDPSRVAGSGIRFRKQGVRGHENISEMEPLVYATNNNGDIGSGSFYGNRLYGDWTAKNTNVYAMVDNGELRITNLKGYNGGNPIYNDLRAREIKTTHSYAFSNHSGSDVYFGVGYHELRITANDFYNGGNPKYQDIRFKNWTAMSHEKYKYDIEEWDYNVLDVFKNELQLHCYKVNSEAATKYARIHHGIVLRENSNLDKFPVEWRNGDGFDGNEIMFWNTKAIQELVFKIEEQNEKINKLEEQLNEQTTS